VLQPYLESWTPEVAASFVGNTSAKEINEQGSTRYNLVRDYFKQQLNQDNQAKALGFRGQSLGLAEERLVAGLRSKVISDWQGVEKPFKDEQAGLVKVENTLRDAEKGGKVSPSALRNLAARVLGGEKGPLSDFDIKQWGGSKALAARIEQWATELATGRMTDTNLKEFRRFIEQAKGSALANFQKTRKDFIERRRGVLPGVDDSFLDQGTQSSFLPSGKAGGSATITLKSGKTISVKKKGAP
jgi:hypothetical protein